MASPGAPSGMEEAVAELKAAFERDPTGFASDELTRSILERLNQEVAALYSTTEDGGAGDEGTEEYDDGEEGERPGSTRGNPRVRVELPKGPRPYDLWREAHEINQAVKERRVLTANEWGGLVHRLNESGKERKRQLMRAQHEQIANELAGFNFTPQINPKSKELAAHNKSLPERVEVLMRRKKSKLDKIRHEKAQSELAEATFKPAINPRRPATAAAQLQRSAEGEGGDARGVGHLMQYEHDKHLRAQQRRQLLLEIENRELTFAPTINRNSSRIVDRLARERSEQLRLAALGVAPPAGLSPPTAARGQKATLNALLSKELDPRAARMLGRSFLPGHEEETFQPRINPRSAALQRRRGEGIHERLFEMAERKKRDHPAGAAGGVAASEAEGEAAAAGAGATLRDASGFPVDEAGEPAPGHPHHFSLVAWEPNGRMDFVLRHLLSDA